MQVESGQLEAPATPEPLSQVSHRVAVIATLLVAVVIGLSVKARNTPPLAGSTPSVVDASALRNTHNAWMAVIATDAAMLLAAAGLVAAYWRKRRMRELLVLLFFTLVLAHLAIWQLLEPQGLIDWSIRLYDKCIYPVWSRCFVPVFTWVFDKFAKLNP